MSIKIITLDMDGTLMAPDHLTVTDRTRSALRAAHDAGVRIAIATGRTMAIVGDVCEQVPQIDYILQSNGAAVYDRRLDRYVCSDLMDWDFAEDIIDFISGLPVFYEIYVDGKSFVDPNKIQYFSNPFIPSRFADELALNMEIHSNPKEHIYGRNIEKINIYCPDCHIDSQLYDSLWAHFAEYDGIDLASSLPGAMEMTRRGVNKGTALKGLCDNLGISADEAMAFGDAGNDCPMLRFAAYSFAMANGTDECKQSAKYIAPSNAEDGVAQMVEKFVLDKLR